MLLSVKNLHTSFFTSSGEVKAVNGVSFDLKRGEVLGIAGESGSGKSVSMLSVLKLLGNSGKIISGKIIFDGQDITKMSENQLEDIRGKKISMIFQDPMTSLNPVLTIGYQISESLKKHNWKGNIKSRVYEMLERVGIVPAEKRFKQYPHEFSGGQRQRIMIAMAMICNPDILIADEPTTALDVTVQAQILDLMKELQKQFGMSIILITHDLGVLAGIADRILVMYGGNIVENGTRREIFYESKHPYTQGLLKSVPNPERPKERLIPIEGQPPDLLNPPKGCAYVSRCPYAMKICLYNKPELKNISESHNVSCWLTEKDNILELEKQAEKGISEIQFQLGKVYFEGAAAIRDEEKAFYWIKKAAEQEHIDALYYLGNMYFYGYGVDQDEEKAMFWHKKAAKEATKFAEKGRADSQYYLGLMYLNGFGIEENTVQGIYWLTQAAEQGFSEAQYELGSFYTYHGKDVNFNNDDSCLEHDIYKDYEKGYMWNYIAELSGYKNASSILNVLESEFLSESEVAEIKAEARKKFYEIQNRIQK